MFNMRILPWRKPGASARSAITAMSLGVALIAVPAGAVSADTPTASRTASAASSCHATWSAVEAPNNAEALSLSSSNSGQSYTSAPIGAVDVLSGRSVWIAATDRSWTQAPYPSGNNISDIERYDGTRWVRSHSPSVPIDAGSGLATLTSLKFDSPDDGWAAGYYLGASFSPLVEHWDGTRWTISPALSYPAQQDPGGTVTGLAAFSATDAWISVARPTGGNGLHPSLVEHWDGRSWTYVDYPLAQTSAVPVVTALYGRAKNDIWLAAGVQGGEDAMHWDGAKWSVVPMPLPTGAGNWTVSSLSATSAHDLWAVGAWKGPNGIAPLTEHWDGAKWTVLPAPVPGDSPVGTLSSVAAISASDAWAVGSYKQGPTPPGNGGTNLIEHWDGQKWTAVPAPGGSPADSATLSSVSAGSATNVWAAGRMEVPNAAGSSTAPQLFHYGCATAR
ncbi:hypothetical protein GCM10029978_051810 [Actinoallomurus acanthiterrae]